jgi:hypothetical protein
VAPFADIRPHSAEPPGLMRIVATMRQIGAKHEGKGQKVKGLSALGAEAASSQQLDAEAEPVEEAQNILSMTPRPVLGKRRRASG